jgi:hypothetical protein
MGKILAFVIGTAVISALLLAPLVYLSEVINKLLIQFGSVDFIVLIWQGLILLAVVLVLAVATLVALFLWEVN